MLIYLIYVTVNKEKWDFPQISCTRTVCSLLREHWLAPDTDAHVIFFTFSQHRLVFRACSSHSRFVSPGIWLSCRRWGASQTRRPARSCEVSSRGRCRSASATWKWWTLYAAELSSPSMSASTNSVTGGGTAPRWTPCLFLGRWSLKVRSSSSIMSREYTRYLSAPWNYVMCCFICDRHKGGSVCVRALGCERRIRGDQGMQQRGAGEVRLWPKRARC